MPDNETSSTHNYGVLTNLTHAQRKTHLFWFSFAVAEIFGFGACIIVGIWAGNYDFHTENIGEGKCTAELAKQSGGHCYTKGGFGTFPSFDYHPFFMSLGFVFLIGQALLVFRLLRGVDKNVLKFVHMSIMIVSLVFMALALHSIVSVVKNGMRNVHDWVGLIAIIGFVLQFICGFVTKIYPGASPSVAAWYHPIHNFAGTIIFVLACTAAMMGMVMAGQNDYSVAGDLAKIFVVCVLIYAIMVVFIIVNDQFRRSENGDQERERLVETSFGRFYQSTDHKPHVNIGDGPSKSVITKELTSKHNTSPSSSLDLTYNEPLPKIKSLSNSDEKELSGKVGQEETFGENLAALEKGPITETPSRQKHTPQPKPNNKPQTHDTLLDWFVEG